MADDRDLAVEEVVAHDGVGDGTGVDFTVLEVSEEQHVDVAFEPDDAVFEVDQLEVSVQVSLPEDQGLVLEVDEAFDGSVELVLLFGVLRVRGFLVILDFSFPLEPELGSGDLLVQFLDRVLERVDLLFERPLVVFRHGEADLREVFSEPAQRVPERVYDFSPNRWYILQPLDHCFDLCVREFVPSWILPKFCRMWSMCSSGFFVCSSICALSSLSSFRFFSAIKLTYLDLPGSF
jgi:hypothetical protein